MPSPRPPPKRRFADRQSNNDGHKIVDVVCHDGEHEEVLHGGLEAKEDAAREVDGGGEGRCVDVGM